MLEQFAFIQELTLEQWVTSWFIMLGIIVSFGIFRLFCCKLKDICLFLINFEYVFFLKLIKLRRTVFDRDSLFKTIPKCFRVVKKVKEFPSEKYFYEGLFNRWLPKENTTKPASRGDYHDTH